MVPPTTAHCDTSRGCEAVHLVSKDVDTHGRQITELFTQSNEIRRLIITTLATAVLSLLGIAFTLIIALSRSSGR